MKHNKTILIVNDRAKATPIIVLTKSKESHIEKSVTGCGGE